MKYRHEVKTEISYGDMLILRQRLSAVAQWDSHAFNGKYQIRSLYFDNAQDKALKEKINGVARREKFRIRFYNQDTSMMLLEKKSKLRDLCRKESTRICAEQAMAIVKGDYQWMMNSEHALIQELYTKIRCQGLKPKTIVDYTREPYVYAPGNVRITIDYHIRTGMNSVQFLNPDCVTVPAGEQKIVLEVKWDEYLPDIIRDVVQLKGRQAGSFSKYAAGRIYG